MITKKVNNVFIVAVALLFSIQAAAQTIVSGRILSRNDVVVMSPISGKVKTVTVALGDKVSKNQVIAHFQCSKQKSNFKVAAAKHNLQKREAENKARLFSQGVLAKEELAIAEAKKLITKEEKNAASVIVNECSIKAPFDGEVVEVFTEQGEYLNLGSNIAHIIKTDKLYGVANVSRLERLNYTVGQQYELKLMDYTGENKKAIVSNISKHITENEVFLVEFELDADDLVSGMLFDVIGKTKNKGNEQ